MIKTLQILQINPALTDKLGRFFDELHSCPAYQHFHPHPMTADYARHVCEHHAGEDLYFAIDGGNRILGYGMLRGWDEGYSIPSLAIAIAPKLRGTGLGECFMHFLHSAARIKGAQRIRLKVYPENIVAHRLYLKLGYRFDMIEQGQLVGLLDL